MLRLFGPLTLACWTLSCTVPDFHYAAPEAVTVDPCSDGKLSPGEADVDCGQICAAACASGSTCSSDDDCASVFCAQGICEDPTCTDSLKDQDETDVDCGGASCPPCEPGKACKSSAECDRTLCTGGKCRAASCSDGIDNQDESDVDCGGDTACARCATGAHCVTDSDCDHAHCSKAKCQPTSCSDGIQNGDETDVDCGGSCSACADLAGCAVSKDCTSLVCTATTHHCAAPNCHDGVQNGSEPTTDCGASCPNQCAVADACAMDADCATGNCTNLHCVPVATGAPLLGTSWAGTASNTVSSDHPPNDALDGDPGTYWTNGAPQVPGMWFQVDMLKPQVFFSITVTALSQPTDYGKTLRLSASTDGQTFTELRTGIAGAPSLNITFNDPQYARYLKLELLEATGGFWWRIDDLTVLQ
jgi:hypothetical protein